MCTLSVCQRWLIFCARLNGLSLGPGCGAGARAPRTSLAAFVSPNRRSSATARGISSRDPCHCWCCLTRLRTKGGSVAEKHSGNTPWTALWSSTHLKAAFLQQGSTYSVWYPCHVFFRTPALAFQEGRPRIIIMLFLKPGRRWASQLRTPHLVCQRRSPGQQQEHICRRQ